MKNIEILGAFNNLNKFISKEQEQKCSLLRIKGAFAVKKNIKVLQDNLQIYQETLNELKEKYNLVFNDDGSISCEDNEKLLDVQNELNELLDCEVEINLVKIKEEDFNEGCSIEDLFLLEFMTESEENENEQ